jgi:type IV secretory pathway TrbD component
MSKERAVAIGLVCGAIAAAFQAWVLLRWLGFGLWFLALVVPLCLVTMQVVGGGVAMVLMRSRRPRS